MSVKKCSKCGQEFTCCNEARGCWCEMVSLDQQTLLLLRKAYENCLCQACLKEFAQEDTAGKIGCN